MCSISSGTSPDSPSRLNAEREFAFAGMWRGLVRLDRCMSLEIRLLENKGPAIERALSTYIATLLIWRRRNNHSLSECGQDRPSSKHCRYRISALPLAESQ
jgi:hypothetical protein